jgi:hypothetical protein
MIHELPERVPFSSVAFHLRNAPKQEDGRIDINNPVHLKGLPQKNRTAAPGLVTTS